MAAKLRAVQERERELRLAQAPLIADLGAVGIHVESVWDLVNTRASYAAAIPVLLNHFTPDYPPEVREGIARALAVREAAWAWDVLLRLFLEEPTSGKRPVKWALACALAGAATNDRVDELIRLVTDQSVGENRLALLQPLAKSRDPRARKTLEGLGEDPQLAREIRLLLGRSKRK
jgi:hypothetical protein